MLTAQDFLDAGYRKFDYTGLRNQAAFGLQKRFGDDTGIKYFITIWAYAPYRTGTDWSFSPDLQFSRHGKATMNIELLLDSDATVQSIEEDVANLWDTLDANYYEYH